ncbi:hypothetical protein C0J52_26698 [Blattella germanica]|nr:hypothetical protein C0J52_26698 [Blattella germanica]
MLYICCNIQETKMPTKFHFVRRSMTDCFILPCLACYCSQIFIQNSEFNVEQLNNTSKKYLPWNVSLEITVIQNAQSRH